MRSALHRTLFAVALAACLPSCVADPPDSTDISSGVGGSSGSGTTGSGGSSGSKSGGAGGSVSGGSAGSVSGAGSSSGGSSGSSGSGLSGGSGGSGGTGPTSDPYAQARQDCVDRINAFRATEGLPPYERWDDAEFCTDDEAQSDSITGEAHGAFGDCDENAQNECPGWDSVDDIIQDCLQSMWDEGPGPFDEHGHYINMSSTDYTMVACGFYETTDGEIWAIQNFR